MLCLCVLFCWGKWEGRRSSKREGDPLCSTENGNKEFISSGSVEATVPGFLLLCCPGVVLLGFEKPDSSGN